MDLSLLSTSVSEFNKQRTGVHFTVRSANSPSYSLIRRPGVRKPRGFSGEERESAEEVWERERYGTQTGPIKKESQPATGYQARSESSSLRDHCLEKDILGHKMSSKLNQNGTADKTITEFGTDRSGNILSESRGRTELKQYDLPSRSKSLDWRTGERNPELGKGADMSTRRIGDISKFSGGLDGRTELQGAKGKVMSSIQAYYNSPGISHVVEKRSPVTHIGQTLDRTGRGHSLPSRMRSQSGPCSNVRVTSASFGPKGGQSILARIEKLYGSAGFGQTEDLSKIRDFSTPVTPHHKETTKDFLIPPQMRSYDWAAGGTFPRRLSSGQTNSLHQLQSRNSFTWTQKDQPASETSLFPRERVSGGQWQEQIQGLNWRRGLGDFGTMSLDRARSKNTVAARIRAARAVGGITTPPRSNSIFDEKRSISSRDSSELRARRLSGSTDWGRVSQGKEKGATNVINGTLREKTVWPELQETDDRVKVKTKTMSISTDEDVFESNTAMKTMEGKKFPERSSALSAASVRNKINQFEALTQRSQGQVLMPRRAFSVPTQLSGAYDGVKKSGSGKEINGSRDKLEGLKEGGENVTGAGKKLGSERSLSVDEVGLRLERKKRERRELIEKEGKETDSVKNSAEDFDMYSRLKSTLEIPIFGGTETRRNFYIEETDFSKVSSPEETSERPTSLLLTNTSTGVKTTSTIVISPVSDEDKTPTNSPNQSPFLSPSTQPENVNPDAVSEKENTSVLAQDADMPEPDSPPHAPTTSSHSAPIDLVTPDVNAVYPKEKKQVLDLDAWVAGVNPKINVWNDNEDDYEDDDDSTQKDEDSNYDSDSGESSVTITSNMSQSDRKSFCVSLSDLCNFAGVDYESENDSDEWQSTGRRSASLSSDMSALSYVSVLPTEELDRLLEDVRGLGDSTLQDYNDVQVVVLHKEVGVGLGFSLAGGIDQNKPVTVHKVFHLGVAAQEGSIREGDQVLSINGTALSGYVHWEALRVLRRAKTRDMGVVVLRKGGTSSVSKRGGQIKNQVPTETQATETGQCVCVRLEKNSRDLGFSLEGGIGSGQENRPLTVQKIFQGGPVDKVCPGDEVLEIEGVSMVGMRRLEAWTLIRRLPPGPVDMVLRRPLKHLET